MKPEDSKMFEKIKALGRKILPKGSSLWLYGSRARGEAREDSDWDLLLLLDKEKPEDSDFGDYAYPFTELGIDNDVYISVQIYTYGSWQKYSFTPYYHNVMADRISLND